MLKKNKSNQMKEMMLMVANPLDSNDPTNIKFYEDALEVIY